MNQLSIFYEHIAEAAEQCGLSLEEVCCKVKEFGYDLVEMDAARLLREEEKILLLLAKSGLAVNCIYNFFSLGEKEDHLEEDRVQIEKVIDLAVRANCSRILVVAGFLKEDELERGSAGYIAHRERIAEGVRLAVAMAAEKGITVIMEDFDGLSAPFSTTDELLWFMENVPGLRCGFDTGNFLYSEEEALEALPTLLPYIGGIHCKDRSFKENDGNIKLTVKDRAMYPVAVGDGELDIETMLLEILASGYTGTITAEHFDTKHQLRDMERSAKFMRSVVEKYYAKL